jgi:predicted KAP-like P-loop ATPase
MSTEEQNTSNTGETVGDKVSNLADAVTGEEDASKTVPEKSTSFVEEISEFAGRVYGQVKSAFSRGSETTEEEADKAEDTAKEGWEDTKKGAEKVRTAAEEGINNLDVEMRNAANSASEGFKKGAEEA